jgi:hypothetical protein
MIHNLNRIQAVVNSNSLNSFTASSRVHCKKMLPIFPSPGGMSLTKLSLAGKILIIPGQGEFGQ